MRCLAQFGQRVQLFFGHFRHGVLSHSRGLVLAPNRLARRRPIVSDAFIHRSTLVFRSRSRGTSETLNSDEFSYANQRDNAYAYAI